MSEPPAVAIVGPTGVGKTALALALAERCDAEIVSVDSRQIYRHLDVGTAKPTAAERARVPHHLLDVVDPDEGFDAARFRDEAGAAIAAIRARGRAVILCGGAGLYLRAAQYGLFPGPPAAPALRAALHARERAGGPGTLHRALAVVDAAAARRLHAHDLPRIVRALEVYELTGRPISAWQQDHAFRTGRLCLRTIGCTRPRDELARQIGDRCRAMLAAGLLEEIEGLWRRGWGPDTAPLRSVGYREMGAYLRGETARADAVAAFERATRQLAKRQLTWFRADPSVEWFHPERERARAIAHAAAWLERPWGPATSSSSSRSPR